MPEFDKPQVAGQPPAPAEPVEVEQVTKKK